MSPISGEDIIGIVILLLIFYGVGAVITGLEFLEKHVAAYWKRTALPSMEERGAAMADRINSLPPEDSEQAYRELEAILKVVERDRDGYQPSVEEAKHALKAAEGTRPIKLRAMYRRNGVRGS